jgi:hypothetical protein
MYRFAYLYVKLGYILAGIVLGVSVVFCGSALLVLELQKPRESAKSFNSEFERIQVAIRSQARTVQQTFGLNPAEPPLVRLKERNWRARSVSRSAAEYLTQQREAALQDCQELRSIVLAKLEADIGLIIGKLESASTSAVTNAPSPSNAPAGSPAGEELDALYADVSEGVGKRINGCEAARRSVAQILQETRNADNRSALERAQIQISQFIEILRSERSSGSLSSEAGSFSVAGAVPAVLSQPQASVPSRKENARLELMSVLSMVRTAVTEGWALEWTIENRLQTELEKFEKRAADNGEAADNRLRTQFVVVGLFLLLLVLAFFIAVGSDLVKAILDSAVWLSHIYTNTSSADFEGGNDENTPS